MLGSRLLPRSGQALPWTCRGCLKQQEQTLRLPIRNFASKSKSKEGTRKRSKAPRRLLVTAAIVGLGVGAANYTEPGRFLWGAAQRTGRVVGTLTVCVNDYRVTLNRGETLPADESTALLKACHKRCAERSLVAMEKNGSIFIKLGQHLSSLNYLLPSEWCDTFIPLQDRCPVSSFESIKQMVEGETGMAFDDCFSEFEQLPLGAASLAQVHRAVDKASGQRVAVKCQHPALAAWAPLDLALTAFTFRMLKRAFPDYDLTWLSDEMEISLPQELDFTKEGDNARAARAYFSNIKEIPLIIPQVLWAKPRVLVMQYITGHRLDDLAYIDTHSISRDEVAASLARLFNIMIFAPDAPLHCDPHGGNIVISANPKRRGAHNFDIILYDHGLYRTIPLALQRSYAKLWLAVLDADEAGMRKYAAEAAGVTDEQFPLFASAITGRDYRAVTQNVSRVARSDAEKQAISDALGDGLLQQLVQLLGKLPRIFLLILKTNDLTRQLDAGLETSAGPLRSFLILARYAARTVFDEQLETLRGTGSLLWPGNAFHLLRAWTSYARIGLKLGLYEWYLHMRALFGLKNEIPAGGLHAA